MPLNVNGHTITPELIREYEYASVIQDGLICHLDARIFDTVSGNTWYDLSGNGNHFTLYNSPTYSNSALNFDGANDYARSTATIDLSGTNGVSVEVIFSVPNVSTGVMVFEHTTDWNSNAGAFGAYTNSNGGAPSSPTTDNDIHTNSATSRIDFAASNLTSLNHFVFIYKTGNSTKCFQNSTQITSTFNASSPNTITGYANANLYIGSRGGSGAFGQMSLRTFKLYNTELTPAEIIQNYNIAANRHGI